MEKIDPQVLNGLLASHRKNREIANRQLNIPSESDEKNNNKGGLKDIKISVTCMGSTETLRRRFSGDDTVGDVAEAVLDQVPAIDKNFSQRRKWNKNMGMTILILGKAQKNDTKLSSIKEGIKGDGQNTIPIHISFTVAGGAYDDHKKENDNERERLADFDNEKRITPTLEPDCIFGYKEMKLRVKMPCGHVFDSLTLYKLTQMYVDNFSKSAIECPVTSCKKIWDLNVVAAAADLDEQEQNRIRSIFSARELLHSGNYKQCKNCKGFVDKPDDLKMIRVRCDAQCCKDRKDFCWCCGQDWVGGGFSVCGNNNCGTKEINTLLQKCGTVKPDYLDGKIDCPEFRVCPRCLSLVQWQSACKHMLCVGCNKEFCYVCLALKSDNGSWPCGTHETHCKVADRQFLK